jgi:hypothetical protein
MHRNVCMHVFCLLNYRTDFYMAEVLYSHMLYYNKFEIFIFLLPVVPEEVLHILAILSVCICWHYVRSDLVQSRSVPRNMFEPISFNFPSQTFMKRVLLWLTFYPRCALHISFWRMLRAALASNSGSFPSTNHHLKTNPTHTEF